MKIILTDDEIVKLIYNAFCNGGLVEFGNSEIELVFDKSDYSKAKETLKAKDYQDTICYEDVLVQLFKDGKLVWVDHNDDKRYEFTPAFVRTNIDELIASDEPNEQAINDIMESLSYNGNSDAWTEYNILQWITFKELIYG